MLYHTPAVKFILPERLVPSKRKVKKTAYVDWGISLFISKKEIQLMKTISNQKPKPKPKPKLQLFLIFLQKVNPMAIINGKAEGIGDKISHITMVEIKADRVILNDGEESFELSMGNE